MGTPGKIRVSFKDDIVAVEIESEGRQVRAELLREVFCELLTVAWREEFLSDVHE